MDITIHASFLPVPHTAPEASLAFYRDALGLEVRQDVGQGTMRWITAAHRPSPAPRSSSTHRAPTRASPRTDQDWGRRDCAYRDPAGSTVRLQQVS